MDNQNKSQSSRPTSRDEPRRRYAQLVAALTVYVRQSHAELDLAELARALRAEASHQRRGATLHASADCFWGYTREPFGQGTHCSVRWTTGSARH